MAFSDEEIAYLQSQPARLRPGLYSRISTPGAGTGPLVSVRRERTVHNP